MSAADADIGKAAGWLAAARSVVVLTGAGISAESRIPTFRDKPENAPEDMKALWAEFDPATLATPEAYARDPAMVTRWYDWRRLLCAKAEPNPGHTALAEVERRLEASGGRFTLLTQNVDGLHRRAGSRNVVELHGSLFAWRGVHTGRHATLPDGPFGSFPPRLEDGEPLRPGVVWFGEMLPEEALDAASSALAGCDLFLSIGTSAVVHPAAGFINVARRNGARTVEINPAPTPMTALVDLSLRGPSGVILPAML